MTGIQLPMLSAGGTSAVITLGAMGVLANVARHEPDAISAMQNYGRPVFDRMLGVQEPRPITQQRQPRQHPREQVQRNHRPTAPVRQATGGPRRVRR